MGKKCSWWEGFLCPHAMVILVLRMLHMQGLIPGRRVRHVGSVHVDKISYLGLTCEFKLELTLCDTAALHRNGKQQTLPFFLFVVIDMS